METLKFKTNINCGGCVATVTPLLNNLKGIQNWTVDTVNPDKVLTVKAIEGLSADRIINALRDKGYTAKSI
ncbi:MAG: heavy-metal-associated domain-containing protein [Bacteroidota bacterium]|nr:heavy-metal-associated domain-containing protein [Bacteroidota bacterium]